MTIADLSRVLDPSERARMDHDFRLAMSRRHAAHLAARYKTPGWRFSHRLDMRGALYAWKHYANAVRRIS